MTHSQYQPQGLAVSAASVKIAVFVLIAAAACLSLFKIAGQTDRQVEGSVQTQIEAASR